LATSSPELDKLAKGCGGCIGNVLRLLTFAFVVAEFVRHLPF